jgi:hypothetical protein
MAKKQNDMHTEYDIISRGLEAEEGSTEIPLLNEEPAPAPEAEPALEGYENMFDLKVGLRPVTLVPLV